MTFECALVVALWTELFSFVAFKLYGVFVATGVAVAVSLVLVVKVMVVTASLVLVVIEIYC